MTPVETLVKVTPSAEVRERSTARLALKKLPLMRVCVHGGIAIHSWTPIKAGPGGQCNRKPLNRTRPRCMIFDNTHI